MSSTGEDRSLTSGIPIPQWMRSKTDNFGFDPSALSPPTNESDIFYIKLPKAQAPEPSTYKSLNEVLEVKQQAFIKHTDSCKQFIPKIQDTVKIKKPKIIKPMGVDDGFKGDAAACGASVVEVAHQMLSGKVKMVPDLRRTETEGNLAPPPYLSRRRDSKSLPVSPIASPETSPRTKRKHNGLLGVNFSTFENSWKGSDGDIKKKSGSSWILSNLFSAKEIQKVDRESKNETSVVATDSIHEEKQKENAADSLIKDPLNVTLEIQTISPSLPMDSHKNPTFKSKPHLRDLNLLTPSTM